MDIGFVGLADGNVARRLARGGVSVLGFASEGGAATLTEESVVIAMPTAVALARALSAPRVVWMNVAPGFATEIMIQELWPELAADDVIVDVSGARYQDAQRRAAALATVRIHFVDCAIAPITGDPAHGHAVVFGADPAAARVFAPYAQLLSPDNGWLHGGPVGSGHFARSVLDGLDRAALHPSTARRAPITAATATADDVVNEAIELNVAAPVLSLARMLQSGRVSGNTDAERLLAAMSDSCSDEPMSTRTPAK